MDALSTRSADTRALAVEDAPARFVTAAALYDGHDAAINIVRRGLVEAGAEVVHLGHNRSALEIAKAAVEEDAGAVAVSSYQGGHEELFPYLRRLLDDEGASHVLIFGGGGGVILPEEIERLERSGVEKIFSPEDGMRLGLEGMMRRMVESTRRAGRLSLARAGELEHGGSAWIAREITRVELGLGEGPGEGPGGERGGRNGLVLGITGPGGAGKSSLVDELVLRLGRDFPALRVGVLAVDPTKRRTGGALLGDRLRMGSIYTPQVFCRSLATRRPGSELAPAVRGAASILLRAGHDLVIVETTGVGQASSAILDVATLSLYVMTADFGGPTQLEKIDMLDFADFVALNKADRRGSDDAARLVRKQVGRRKRQPGPVVVATMASRFNDPGTNDLYAAVVRRLAELDGRFRGEIASSSPVPSIRAIPPARERHLGEAAEAVRRYRERTRTDAERMGALESLERAAGEIASREPPSSGALLEELRAAASRTREGLEDAEAELEAWRRLEEEHAAGRLRYRVRERAVDVDLRRKTLSGLRIPRVALPRFLSRAELLRFLREENLPGRFPFTAGVYPAKREDELPTRQFAGEGTPSRTNRRFHLLCAGQSARRLSVAFDSVTLYGADPGERPDIYGKIGTSGVSVATLDDMRKLFEGFDLLDPSTSVSMTINGPAPAILAMFLNAAIDQQADRFRGETGHDPGPEERARIRARVLENVRGTVQADILKEDQAQNTCILSTEFALKLLGDVQEFFVRNGVRNYYSLSISGYHMAEAGANPITQLAFTLANGLTYLELFKARGLEVDDFAPSFSFFFSNGLDAEYAVLGRVARRIWAVVLRDVYGASERSQKLKYHVQTSGRSLHSREVAFNDIRTTLQALLAVFDNCNSLHTNAYDEAVTTPTEESVRRALAIQLILQKEMGLAANENPLQGSFLVRELTDLVEEAVLAELERLADRGGVLGAMETGYMRGRIQDESLLYEELKHSGALPIIGVNAFVDPAAGSSVVDRLPVVRSTDEEKREQIRNLRQFQERNREASARGLERLRQAALRGEPLFDELLEAVRHSSLGQVLGALYEVGGRYRRNL
ncbi:MAG: cobalamin B12-binding domain-containing protein [Planctomycetes bacterium]|nr:cobalamin B12-binding domain-containing protein [Planctomycetota bacterium]